MAAAGVRRMWQDCRLFGSLTVLDNVILGSGYHPGETAWRSLLQPRRVADAERSRRQEAEEIIDRVGLIGRASSSADKLSLGQEKRTAIGRAVAGGGRVLLL